MRLYLSSKIFHLVPVASDPTGVLLNYWYLSTACVPVCLKDAWIWYLLHTVCSSPWSYCISVLETLLETLSMGNLGWVRTCMNGFVLPYFVFPQFFTTKLHKAWEFNSTLPQGIKATHFGKKMSVLAVKCDCWSASELFYSCTFFFFWRNK